MHYFFIHKFLCRGASHHTTLTSGGVRIRWQSKQDGIMAIKIDRTRIHFLISDVFTVLAVVGSVIYSLLNLKHWRMLVRYRECLLQKRWLILENTAFLFMCSRCVSSQDDLSLWDAFVNSRGVKWVAVGAKVIEKCTRKLPWRDLQWRWSWTTRGKLLISHVSEFPWKRSHGHNLISKSRVLVIFFSCYQILPNRKLK